MPRSRWIPLTQADKNWDLFDAIEAGDGEGVLLALKRGADVRATDSYGFMPLHWAVAYVGSSTKDTGIIEALLDRGARYNQRSGTPAVDCYDPPETPLEWAARHPDLRPLRLFFARGGDPNDHDPYMSPLFAAVSEGTVASVELLLSAGAGVDVQNWAGDSLLHCAARTGDIAKIVLVSERGIDVKGRGSVGHTPLHCAAEAGNDAAIALLLAHGAEIHAGDD